MKALKTCTVEAESAGTLKWSRDTICKKAVSDRAKDFLKIGNILSGSAYDLKSKLGE